MTEQFRQHPENPKQKAPEAGAGPLGIPPPTPEQSPQRGGSQSPERQPLPGAWAILEQRVRIQEERSSNRMTRDEYDREQHKLIGLENEIEEKGTPLDNLILDLYTEITSEPAPLPVSIDFKDLSLEEFQQFRSKVKPMSEEEIREEIRKAQAEFERKVKGIPGRNPPPPGSTIRV